MSFLKNKFMTQLGRLLSTMREVFSASEATLVPNRQQGEDFVGFLTHTDNTHHYFPLVGLWGCGSYPSYTFFSFCPGPDVAVGKVGEEEEAGLRTIVTQKSQQSAKREIVMEINNWKRKCKTKNNLFCATFQCPQIKPSCFPKTCILSPPTPCCPTPFGSV